MSAAGFDVPPVRPGAPLIQRIGRTPRVGDDAPRQQNPDGAPHESPDEEESRPAPADEHSGHKLDVEA